MIIQAEQKAKDEMRAFVISIALTIPLMEHIDTAIFGTQGNFFTKVMIGVLCCRAYHFLIAGIIARGRLLLNLLRCS
jgi:hypothetical protein